ncbi:MAG: amidohydrolase family protein, partial [Spongiibacteraceae bacterium]
MDGRVLPNPGTNAVVGNPPEEYGMEPLSYDQIRKGVYDVHARIDDMNVNGIVGSLCFGSIFGFEGGAFINVENKDHALTLVKAYNDWHIDEWCGAYPGRFIPCAIVPLWDIKLIVEEIQRVVKKGCRAISFTDNPAAKKLPSLHSDYWEPLWKICADEGVIICNHIGSGNVP